MPTQQAITPGSLRQRHSPGRRLPGRGFTLVEMLVALTISSLLVVATVSATRALTTARESVDRRAERVSEARRAMETILAGLRNVRRDPLPNKPLIIGRSGGRGMGNDSITLLTISDRTVRRGHPESDQQELSFFLAEPGRDLPPRLLCRRDHAFDDHPEEGGVASIVAEGIASLSFEYFSAGDWYHEWRASEPRPPQAVRVTLAALTTWPAGSRRQPETTVLSSVVVIRANQPAADSGSRPNNPGQPGSPSVGGPPS